MKILDLSDECSVDHLDHQVTSSFAWTRDAINPSDCIVNLNTAARDEMMDMVDLMEANPLPTLLRKPAHFDIPHTIKLMQEIKHRLDMPPGVAVINSLPLDQITEQQAIDVFWVIGQMVGRNVSQKWDGTMIYHVRDTGAKYEYGVRGSYTSVELLFHNDNAFGVTLPHYVGLLCIRPSIQGGISRFCSLYTVHNRMLKKYPTELKRLYQPVYWDRQAEHAQGQPIVLKAPVFRYQRDRLWTRANPSLIKKGYEVAEITMDDATEDAVLALKEISEDPTLWFELPIERGHVQYLNNIDIAHYRSEFVDHCDEDKKRHLIRLWHRDSGQITYDG